MILGSIATVPEIRSVFSQGEFMSIENCNEPVCEEGADSIQLVIRSVEKDLGEMTVRRILPSLRRRAVGPFVFFDHMGPAQFPPGAGISVRPHPHIGIATITYLFEGEIFHRDGLGYAQPIQAGAVNLMTAGKGIVHSERAGSDLNEVSTLHGIQSWMALPDDREECEPGFEHFPADAIPQTELNNVTIRVIIGSAFGKTSPVPVYSRMLYLELRMPNESRLAMPEDVGELGIYVVSGTITVDSSDYSDGEMIIAATGHCPTIKAGANSRVMVIGGDSVGDRHLWWNFVSSSKSRIEEAKKEWASGGFSRIADDPEFIPLPGVKQR